MEVAALCHSFDKSFKIDLPKANPNYSIFNLQYSIFQSLIWRKNFKLRGALPR
jgi:hypothetical protein